VSFGDRFGTPTPASFEPKISSQQALENVRAAMQPYKKDITLRRAELVVVDPDRQRGLRPYGQRRALAWLLTLGEGDQAAVVDAQTGEVLSISGQLGGAPPESDASAAPPGYCGDAPAAPEGFCPDVSAVLEKGYDLTVTFRTTSFPPRQRTAMVSLTEDMASPLVKCISRCAGLSPDGPPRNGDTFTLSVRKNGEPPAELVWWKAVAGEGFLYGTHEREPHAFCRWSTSDEFGNILERLVSDVPFKPWRYWEEEK
jgi:hypothetical protein